ncbi:MAG: LCP family protein [Erysipelotrichaceae bacterium]|nr:LCP family protein [Erysipelotrichaceae bacterium]
MTKKRSEIQKRRKIIFLTAVILLVLAVGGILILRAVGSKETGSGSFQESSQEGDTIRYDGKTYRYNDHLSNYLFMGIDTREKVETYETQRDAGQADAIFLVSLDRAKKKLQVILIPRDTVTRIETFNLSGKSLGMTEDHINLQYAFGDGKEKSCELMKKAVSELLYQIPIEGYCSLNMDGIPVLTGLVGGVEVTVPDDSLAQVNPEFQKGAQVTLTEENTEQFVRYRDITTSQSAIVRMNRQKVFLQAFLNKVQGLAAKDAGIVTTLYDGVQDYMVTGMGNDLFVKLLEATYENAPEVETLPGEGVQGEYFDEYHVDEDGLYDLIIRMFYKEVEA